MVTINKFSGINNVSLPDLCKPSEFQIMDNVLVMDDGSLRRRSGSHVISGGNRRSVFPTNEGLLFAEGTSLKMYNNGTITTLDSVQSSAVALYWNRARPETGVVQVSGLAFTPWSSQPVRFLELELVGVDSGERTVSDVGTKAPYIQLFTNQSTPFELTLRTTGGETRFDLYYRYRFQDGGRDRIVASLAWDGPMLFAQQVQFRVWNACSETLHRVH